MGFKLRKTHKSSASAERFLRYVSEHPHCRFTWSSGVIKNRSIKDYARIAAPSKVQLQEQGE